VCCVCGWAISNRRGSALFFWVGCTRWDCLHLSLFFLPPKSSEKKKKRLAIVEGRGAGPRAKKGDHSDGSIIKWGKSSLSLSRPSLLIRRDLGVSRSVTLFFSLSAVMMMPHLRMSSCLDPAGTYSASQMVIYARPFSPHCHSLSFSLDPILRLFTIRP
jgi:hypothetical protein